MKKNLSKPFRSEHGLMIGSGCAVVVAMAAMAFMTLRRVIPGQPLAMLSFAFGLATITLCVGAVILWAWYVCRPMLELAGAIGRYGTPGASDQPLAEDGPIELREAMRAFNAMQTRLARSAARRRDELMAIAHDLRTPLTRLAMRVHMGGDYAEPAKMEAEVSLLMEMLGSAMALFSGHDEQENWGEFDLAALATDVCLSFRGAGKDVHLRCGGAAWVVCQKIAIIRLLDNLIENGCRFGSRVSVDVRNDDGYVIIEVCDDGPGLHNTKRKHALCDISRPKCHDSATNTHFGLGLSIVAKIVENHNGTAELLDATPHGLKVVVRLPAGAVVNI
ncbi:sensor histidine kinase [Acidomonas methanolica]|uniref:sensor histidine kinase n=1 Tax=Acidomonas methanolica TaxID=437 RepID=UPI00211A5519|nr:HAMP domain-containing sensor histidine kinase [Acidomonas methanolica]MCQ9156859.1 HAMP domain-containing histidine kinase [Acidomonas methanolica]